MPRFRLTLALTGAATAAAALGSALLAPVPLRLVVWLPVAALWAGLAGQARALAGLLAAERDRAAGWQQRYASVTATTHELVWSVDAEGRLTYLGPNSAPMLGYEPRELVGRPLAELVHPETARRIGAAWSAAVVANHGFRGMPIRFVHADGSDRWFDSSGVPARDATGRLLGFDGTSRPIDDPTELRAANRRMRSQIETLLAQGALRIALQPIIDLTTGDVVGAEALSRFPTWRTDVWFRDAAALGLGPDLELLAIQVALRALEELPEPAYLAVNVSPAALANPRLVALLDRAEAPVERLVVEITEHATVDDYPALEHPLAWLRGRGARIAVDDAGAGYASFRHILRLHPELIKLDRDLVAGVSSDLARRALVASVVAYAVQTDCVVVAEGIEQAEDLEALSLLGVDCGQGFLLARPTSDPADWRSWRRSLVLP